MTDRVDLVLATIGRTTDLERFLASLDGQAGLGRLIVVDQTDDDRVARLLAREPDLPVERLTCERGLSRSRNLGLGRAEAEIVGFPDDDCRYTPGLLDAVVSLFAAHPEWDGLSVRLLDAKGKPSNLRWDTRAGTIDRFNMWRRMLSATLFVRRSALASVGPFDETLGVGSGTSWASSEEADIVLRLLTSGSRIEYVPHLTVLHEQPAVDWSRATAGRAFANGMGHGLVLRRHGFPRRFLVRRVAELLAAGAYFLLRGQPARARFYLAMARGRIAGWAHPPDGSS